MSKVQNKVSDFLKKYEIDPDDIDIESNSRIFLEEMTKGLSGQKSSLEMIPTYIDTEGQVPTDETVIVLDAGGTNSNGHVQISVK